MILHARVKKGLFPGRMTLGSTVKVFFFARMLAKAALLKGHTLTKDHEIKPVLVDVEESLKEQERDRKRRQKKEKLMSDVSARHSRVIFLFHVKICVIHLA